MTTQEQLFSAIAQVLAVLVIGGLSYGAALLCFRRRMAGQSFAGFMGLSLPRLDGVFLAIWLGLALVAFLSTCLEFRFSGAIRQLLLSNQSPYGRILAAGLTPAAFLKAVIYCFLQASLSEELLFRGLVAKRLFAWLGFARGNVAQALVFWLMHLLLFRAISGEWRSVLQLITFATAFGLGLVLGWANHRQRGGSIGPSWILHGSANFVSFLTLAFLGRP